MIISHNWCRFLWYIQSMKALAYFSILISCLQLTGQESDPTKFTAEYYRAGYTFDVFDDQLSDWHTGYVGIKISNEIWQFLPGINVGQRFDQTGINIQTETYRSFSNKDYLQIDLDYSPDAIFPTFRAGIEYYNPFGEWEHSLGVRYLKFETTGALVLVSKSLSKYYGNNLSIIRLNGAWAFDGGDFTNYGAFLQHRYYFSDSKYLAFFGSYGFDTSLILVGDNASISSNDPYLVSLGAKYETDFNKRKKWQFIYTWTRYDFQVTERNQHTLSVFFILSKEDS